MIAGFSLLGKAVLAGPEDVGEIDFPLAWPPIVLSADAETQYLVEVTAFTGETFRVAGPDMGFGVLGDFTAAAPYGEGAVSGGGLATLTWADRDWHGAPDDPDKPNAAYLGRVPVPFRIRRMVPIEPEEEAGITREFGEIEIAAADGALDSIVPSHAVDGRPVRVLFGPYMGRYLDFRPIADVLGDKWETDGDIARLYVRDRNYALDRPLQERTYEGTGGGEGTDQMTGLPMPRLWGRRRNIRPDFVDPAVDLYRVNSGPMLAVDAVYDRGAELPLDQDFADAAALIAASIPSGEYGTCLAEGLFRLGAPAEGLVTCDARGTISQFAGGYVDTVDQIMLTILRDDAVTPLGSIDQSSFALLAAIGGEMGWYAPSSESPSFGDTLREIARSVGGFIGNGRTGRIRAGRLRSPEGRTPQFVFNQWNAVSFQLRETLRPRFRQRVGFQANGTIQRGEDLAEIVSAERRQFLGEPYRLATNFQGGIRVKYPEALDPPVMESPYDQATDAAALAAHLMNRHGPERQLWELRARRASFLFDLGAVVRVEWPRLAPAGRNFVIVEIDEDTAAPSDAGGSVEQSILTLWG